MKVLNFILLIFVSIKLTYCEVFTALADLEQLVYTESFLVDSLENYTQNLEQKLSTLKRYVNIYKSQHDIALQDVQAYTANPINSYLLIKRLAVDWLKIKEHCNKNIENFEEIRSKTNLKFPKFEDLNGAASALIKLQDTYKLRVEELVKGEINGIKFNSKLSAHDCFELGRQSYNNDNYYHAVLWLREAYNQTKSQEEVVSEQANKIQILEYLAFSVYKEGNVPLALNLTNQLLQLDPLHKRANLNKQYYEAELKNSHNLSTPPLNLSFIDNQKPNYWNEKYEHNNRICRGDITPPIEITSKLSCYYLNNNIAFLKIAPFKVEEAYNDPLILIFYDIMSDNEIEVIKQLAKPNFNRAAVFNSQTGEYEAVTYRISKSAWLYNHQHEVIETISRRVGDMTSLDQKSAEPLQVGNYGIGGHYNAHYDFAQKHEQDLFKLGVGNRIATVLFYMSDVEQGGATSFPNIKAAVWPKKGSAVFWYNLFPSGEGNKNTMHAACPVLVGSKWVSNKWIHEYYQEFRRPCELKPAPPELTA